jgi:hypothetical protein
LRVNGLAANGYDANGVMPDERAAIVTRSLYAVTMIGLWRALAVGTLHAYHSIRIKFMQSRGYAHPPHHTRVHAEKSRISPCPCSPRRSHP